MDRNATSVDRIGAPRYEARGDRASNQLDCAVMPNLQALRYGFDGNPLTSWRAANREK